MVDWVREALESIDWSKHRRLGRVTLPRLTKLEYNNTLRDLLGVDLRAGDKLLDDGQGTSGFNNDRDALFISPALAEQYFEAAEYALQAILDLRKEPIKLHLESEKMLMTERGSKPENLPGGGDPAGGGFGYSLAGAGQRTLFDELQVPSDGWYRLTVRCVGIGADSGMRLRIDNQPRHDFYCVHQKPQEQQIELLLTRGTHQMTWNIQVPSKMEAAVPTLPPAVASKAKPRNSQAKPLPENAADLVTAACETNAPVYPVPEGATAELQALIRRFNASLNGMQRRIEYMRLVTPEGRESDLRNYYNLLPQRAQAMAEIKIELAAALDLTTEEIDRRLLSANRSRFANNQMVLAESLPVIGVDYHPDLLFGKVAGAPKPEKAKPVAGAPGVDWIRIEGPILPTEPPATMGRLEDWSNVPTQPRLVESLFQDDALQALTDFLPRAFRRPLRTGELERYRGLYEKTLQRGESHDQSLKIAFAAALASPNFLFRDELSSETVSPPRGAEGYRLNDYQLASRLSYFLWMTMPDERLRNLADRGQLSDTGTLREEVQRMLRDGKSRAFTASFMGQWLGFSGLGTEHVPDSRKFRQFTPQLAEAMKLEPVLLLEELLKNGGSLTRLLDSQATYANSELAAVYGIDGVDGEKMQAVKFPDDSRAGLLGMAAVLTASSTPNRTSPVLRGKWVLENLLGRHLAEPPADAGQLDDKAGERGKTLREELAAHRRSEACASCHDKIDPIGFGLENFDAIGRFRSMVAGRHVDATGSLPGGHSFSGPAELRALIQSRHQDEFIKNVTRRMMAFALGRRLRVEDEGLIRQLLVELRKSQYRADALVEAIVTSEPFGKQGGVEP